MSNASDSERPSERAMRLSEESRRGATAREYQHQWLQELDRFIAATSTGPRFNGQSQAVRALRRIRALSVFQ